MPNVYKVKLRTTQCPLTPRATALKEWGASQAEETWTRTQTDLPQRKGGERQVVVSVRL